MAATQRGFRPRPLDSQKQLPIVTDFSQLESTADPVQRDIVNNHEALDKNNEEPKMVKAKGGKEIPIPHVNDVVGYKIEYLPSFRGPTTYVRSGGLAHEERQVEYDMDPDDEVWLEKLNGDQMRLSEQRFELLMDTLERANAAATDRIMTSQGATQAEKQTPAAVAAIENLWKQEALEVMLAAHPVREPIRCAVFEYWRQKRLALNRPLLRSLQAPTATGDSNPYNVFRPRDRIHRPQTRRRRENNEDSLDKLRQIQQNLAAAKDLLKEIVKREQRKTQIVVLEIDSQQYQIRRAHEPRSMWDQIDAEFSSALKSKQAHRKPLGWEHPNADGHQNKKRRKEKAMSMESLGPPPPQPYIPPVFEVPIDLSALAIKNPDGEGLWQPNVDVARCRARIGRGGRLIFDRCDWRTLKPITEPDDSAVVPLWQQPQVFGFTHPEAGLSRSRTAAGGNGRG
eukprot:jgi/Botrbrau1/23213/Bobra.0041s0057.1